MQKSQYLAGIGRKTGVNLDYAGKFSLKGRKGKRKGKREEREEERRRGRKESKIAM